MGPDERSLHNDCVIRMSENPKSPLGSSTFRCLFAAGTVVGVLSLAACATSPGGIASPSSTPSASTLTQEPSPSPTVVETVPAPTPTESATVVAPYNGDVLVVSAEDVDGRLEVTAMIPGVSEDTGTCRLELIDEAGSASVTSTAGNGVTYCGIMSVEPKADAGQWRFRVRYESVTTRAESDISTVELTR
jgi:hypothetical protein